MHYNRHRYYDPQSSQYLSSDPIGLAGGLTPQSYAPNPNIYIDPLGLSICKLKGLQNKFDELAEKYLLPKFRKMDPNLQAGYKGSFKTGKVGNPNKPTYGQPINLDKFDIDYWIKSDILYEKFGKNLRADVGFRKLLSKVPGFGGLKPNKQGFSIKFLPLSK